MNDAPEKDLFDKQRLHKLLTKKKKRMFGLNNWSQRMLKVAILDRSRFVNRLKIQFVG